MDPDYERIGQGGLSGDESESSGATDGHFLSFNLEPALEATQEEREAQYEEFWQRADCHSLAPSAICFSRKTPTKPLPSLRGVRIRDVVDDPEVAELCAPTMCSVVNASASIRVTIRSTTNRT